VVQEQIDKILPSPQTSENVECIDKDISDIETFKDLD
jgi:hypothetical protein